MNGVNQVPGQGLESIQLTKMQKSIIRKLLLLYDNNNHHTHTQIPLNSSVRIF